MAPGPQQPAGLSSGRQFRHGKGRGVFLGGTTVRGCVPRAVVGTSPGWGSGAAAAGVRTLVWSPPTPGLFVVKG
jgi:hypothetical protein